MSTLGKVVKFLKNRGVIVGTIAAITGIGLAVYDTRKDKDVVFEATIIVEDNEEEIEDSVKIDDSDIEI